MIGMVKPRPKSKQKELQTDLPDVTSPRIMEDKGMITNANNIGRDIAQSGKGIEALMPTEPATMKEEGITKIQGIDTLAETTSNATNQGKDTPAETDMTNATGARVQGNIRREGIEALLQGDPGMNPEIIHLSHQRPTTLQLDQSGSQTTKDVQQRPVLGTDQTTSSRHQLGRREQDKNPMRGMKAKREIEDIRDLKLIYWNCSHGIASKIEIVKEIINEHRPHVMFVSESEIKANQDLDFYNIEGYQLHLANTIKSRNKSRIIAYSDKRLKLDRKSELEGEYQDIIALDLNKIRLIGLYNPFKVHEGETRSGNFHRLIDTLKSVKEQNRDLIVGGDFNVDWSTENAHKIKLTSWAEDEELHQIVNEHTRHRCVKLENGSRMETSTIDHVYVKDELKIKPRIIPTIWSDHDVILVSYPYKVELTTLKKKLLLREWRNYNARKMIKILLKHQEIRYNIGKLIQLIHQIMDDEIPLRVVRFKPQLGQIASTKVAKRTKKRDRQIKLWKKYGNIYHFQYAQYLSKTLRGIIKRERKVKIQTKLQTPNAKTFWHMIKGLTGKNKHSEELNIEKKDGSLTSNEKEISEMFVDFFSEKVKKLSGLTQDEWESEWIPRQEPSSYLDITTDDIIKASKLLKSKKCYGPDGIPLRIIKDIGTLAPELIVNSFNLFVRNGMPENLKVSRIIPLHKKLTKTNIENYRPIANLSSIAKLYEKVILKKLQDETKDQEGDYQHAYRAHHSTTSALLELQHKISKNLEKNPLVAVYSMDLSAAFDLLRVDIMLETLKEIEISHGLAKVIEDFLTWRRIYVEVSGERSKQVSMPLGCVQGSILGPRLFTLYMGKLKQVLQHEDVISYADDSYVIIAAKDMEDLKAKTKTISTRHVNYLQRLGMVVNTTKTEIVIFNKNPMEEIFEIHTSQVKSQSSMKALGVVFQHNLKWDLHVQNLIKRANPKLSVLKKIRKNLDMTQFLKIATSQIFSILYYASPVWLNSTCSQALWDRLKSFHYRVLRAATCDYKRRKPRVLLDKKCKRATPQMWGAYSTYSLVLKIIRDRYPKYLYDQLSTTLYTESRKPLIGKFYDNSKGKVGKHRLECRLTALKDLEWYGLELSNDAIRTSLKKFLNFNND